MWGGGGHVMGRAREELNANGRDMHASESKRPAGAKAPQVQPAPYREYQPLRIPTPPSIYAMCDYYPFSWTGGQFHPARRHAETMSRTTGSNTVLSETMLRDISILSPRFSVIMQGRREEGAEEAITIWPWAHYPPGSALILNGSVQERKGTGRDGNANSNYNFEAVWCYGYDIFLNMSQLVDSNIE
ncbi:hypothetical protein PILCRDRAFT_694538 [Piloderma croceum F 1598]|uniref:Uncharacterized protein n=1 Tax=Piloderma croceum (strain F 1598) TaxID=765440 RepID=A0A0C3F4J8_PILCF|nr:hypothetical protein PILCRDRAFT_694538 [Piloderma croceum F 1598]